MGSVDSRGPRLVWPAQLHKQGLENNRKSQLEKVDNTAPVASMLNRFEFEHMYKNATKHT